MIERTLAGEGESLKEYVFGIEVFDRGESFDPRTDTIVRVQARRLRTRLEDYYGAEGQFDPVRIDDADGTLVAPVPRLVPPVAAAAPAVSASDAAPHDGYSHADRASRHGCRRPEHRSSVASRN